MIIVAQNRKAACVVENSRLLVQESHDAEGDRKPWVVVAIDNRMTTKDHHPIILSSHDTEEQAIDALELICRQVSAYFMPKNDFDIKNAVDICGAVGETFLSRNTNF